MFSTMDRVAVLHLFDHKMPLLTLVSALPFLASHLVLILKLNADPI